MRKMRFFDMIYSPPYKRELPCQPLNYSGIKKSRDVLKNGMKKQNLTRAIDILDRL